MRHNQKNAGMFKMKRITRFSGVCRLFIASFAMCGNAHSQAFGVSINAGLLTNLPTTTEGGGGEYINEPPPVGPLSQSTLGIIPIVYSDSVTGYDPQVNAVITAEASAGIQLASAYKGSLSFSISNSGKTPTDAPGDGYDYVGLTWTDTLYVKNLPVGTPVTLKITYAVYGGYRNTEPANTDAALEYAFQVTDIASPNNEVGDEVTVNTPRTIASRHSYLFHTFSGDSLSLLSVIDGNFSGSTNWSISGSINTAMVYVDVATPRAIVRSASGVDYSSSDLVGVPNVTGDAVSVAVNALISAGLGVGSITNQTSKTVAAGNVVSQSPSGNSQVVSGAPINLVVSSGPPSK